MQKGHLEQQEEEILLAHTTGRGQRDVSRDRATWNGPGAPGRKDQVFRCGRELTSAERDGINQNLEEGRHGAESLLCLDGVLGSDERMKPKEWESWKTWNLCSGHNGWGAPIVKAREGQDEFRMGWTQWCFMKKLWQQRLEEKMEVGQQFQWPLELVDWSHGKRERDLTVQSISI